MVLSRRTCQAPLPRKPCRCRVSIRKIFLDRTFWCPWLASVSSPLVSDVSTLCELCDGLPQPIKYFIQLCQQKNGHYRPNMTLLKPNKAGDTNYSSRETATELSPPRKRSDTRRPSDDQWHESRWQHNR